ncbi:hypothetical protein N7457_000080 [Penicillium paradoxum]|uniref:uncharacterized protein n=1 Tax=Penicillium paradoxum TaxID=176176 RepID=UPI0025493737|nr:uncharacterized protein N7457_000080 [Penicillium paradoxum]KAJ5793481.1 hypothetical protein N7457_000080 [Penicillium paradoxum]
MYNNKLYLSSLLALQACTRVMGASATSGVLEVDLVFPRNETYAPSPDMPVVFAIQNPHLAAPLNMRVTYLITPPGIYENTTETTLFNMNSTSSSDLDSHFVYNKTDVDTEDVWELTWFVEYGRCTGSKGDMMYYNSNFTIDSIIFTTKSGAAKPDLVAVSNDDTCPKGIAAWNVTSTLEVEGTNWGGYDTCAVVSEKFPWAKGQPCAAGFDSAAASNISAALKGTGCAASGCSEDGKNSTNDQDSKDSEDSADDKDSADKSAAGALNLPGAALLTTIVAGLAYILA